MCEYDIIYFGVHLENFIWFVKILTRKDDSDGEGEAWNRMIETLKFEGQNGNKLNQLLPLSVLMFIIGKTVKERKKKKD